MKKEYGPTGEGCLLNNLVGPNPAFYIYTYIKAPFRLTSSLRVHLSVSALRAALHLGTSLSW